VKLNDSGVTVRQQKGTKGMKKLPALVVSLSLLTFASAAKLKERTLAEFQEYVASAEAAMDKNLEDDDPFLWVDSQPSGRERLRDGKILVERVGSTKSIKIKDGLIHDWVGTVFIPTTPENVIELLRDYDNHQEIYPEVIQSRLVSLNGDNLQGYLRLKKKKVITVILATELDVTYYKVDETRWHSRSHSTRISEVTDVGKTSERELPDGEGHGFMWRLNSYWRFEQVKDGVIAECRTISLSRKIPFGLGWIISPFVDGLPRESLAGMLTATRQAIEDSNSARNLVQSPETEKRVGG
jgi:hypothetical protein